MSFETSKYFPHSCTCWSLNEEDEARVEAKIYITFFPNNWFRIFDENTKSHTWDRVTKLEKGVIYYEGTVKMLQNLTGWRGHRVLYFGDHPYSDLAGKKRSRKFQRDTTFIFSKSCRCNTRTWLANWSHHPRALGKNYKMNVLLADFMTVHSIAWNWNAQ